ncbi:putative signal transduction histidine kinase [Syntrophobotulus glycolicus DSM 8271]|uniref:histidine kinase n=1 Tax=Syntrophobotulus glycolicus (strain DSM 8271 / FlGlyR) TaxID=645991 RepID=F0T1C4_SYNGF|nr:ATP-binding protein [Syntrophobotulus glycolicus]ADY55188.1 putative signal transduction histidine kinase [Syntrophobotulus glycolicus DSM 8271]
MGDLKRVFAFSASAMILFSLYYLLSVIINIPYIGICVKKNQTGIWQITNVDKLGWAEQHGIKTGDIVSLIDEIQPSNYPTVLQYNAIERAKTLVISKNHESMVFNVSNNMTPKQVQYDIVIPLFLFGILSSFSFFLYLKKGNDESSRILILFFLTIGLSYISAGASSRMDIVGISINRITFSLIPLLFVEFLIAYFKRYGFILYNRKYLYIFYIGNGLLFSINLFFQIFGLYLLDIRYCFLANFIIETFLCLHILTTRYIRYRNTIHGSVFAIIIVGVILAFFPFIFLVGLPSLVFGIELIPGALGAVFIVFIPIVFFYLITANSLFDIDFIINRIRYYCIISLIPTSGYLWFLFYLAKRFTFVQRVQVGIVTYIGIIAFLYAKEELDLSLRSKLFREKFNFQASLNRFSQNITKVMKVSDLEEQLITEVREVLSVKSISLLELDLTDSDYSLLIKTGTQDVPKLTILEWLENNVHLISVGDLIDIDNGVLLTVSQEKNKYHFLWIRGKINRTHYNQDERVWLKTISFYVSVVYENLHMIEGLIDKLEEAVSQKDTARPWVSRLLFSLSEKERRRLASDLHDSVLQEQILWYRKLQIISSDDRLPIDLREELNKIAEGLLDVTHEIRITCNDLFPSLLNESRIVDAIRNLIADAQLRTDYVVNFNATDFSLDLDYEHILAIYRIVQELLANAAKHSKATEINITLDNSNGLLALNYHDNGIGMDLQSMEFTSNHMGLSGIKERVSSLGGETRIYSTLGESFEVSIWMDLDTNFVATEQVI